MLYRGKKALSKVYSCRANFPSYQCHILPHFLKFFKCLSTFIFWEQSAHLSSLSSLWESLDSDSCSLSGYSSRSDSDLLSSDYSPSDDDVSEEDEVQLPRKRLSRKRPPSNDGQPPSKKPRTEAVQGRVVGAESDDDRGGDKESRGGKGDEGGHQGDRGGHRGNRGRKAGRGGKRGGRGRGGGIAGSRGRSEMHSKQQCAKDTCNLPLSAVSMECKDTAYAGQAEFNPLRLPGPHVPDGIEVSALPCLNYFLMM